MLSVLETLHTLAVFKKFSVSLIRSQIELPYRKGKSSTGPRGFSFNLMGVGCGGGVAGLERSPLKPPVLHM